MLGLCLVTAFMCYQRYSGTSTIEPGSEICSEQCEPLASNEQNLLADSVIMAPRMMVLPTRQAVAVSLPVPKLDLTAVSRLQTSTSGPQETNREATIPTVVTRTGEGLQHRTISNDQPRSLARAEPEKINQDVQHQFSGQGLPRLSRSAVELLTHTE